MGPAVFFGAFVVILALASRAMGSSTSSPQPDLLPPKPKPEDLEDKAKEARELGDDETADALEEKADIHKEIQAETKELPPKMPSPIAGVEDAAWRKYVSTQRGAGLGTITKSYLLGMFLLGMRVLQDVGMARNVKLQDFKGRQVFKGDFVPPITEARFLSEASLQYEAFKRMTAAHAKYIATKYPDVIKEGHVSLSGLLAVAKQAGLTGMDKWLLDPANRKESTTAAFKRANGIF